MNRLNIVAETTALLTILVSAMVADKDAVKVTTASGLGGSVVFTLEVAQQDRGKVLGRKGTMARSLRSILASIGKEHGQTFFLEVHMGPGGALLQTCPFERVSEPQVSHAN